MKKDIKVLIAMSGGVDSSVAAALLAKQGYDVTGAFMVNYEGNNNNVTDTSCWVPDYRDAVRVAAKLGIKLMRLNFTREYKTKVLDYMYKEYKAGRTPNPDVLCNKYIKFGYWLDWALKNGFDYLATGHYARVNKENKSCKLLVAKDKNKDQTYFLHQLNQTQLKHTMFPIGNYTKAEVRKLAKKFKLPTADKEESMGICFVGEVSMKEFLQKKIKVKSGDIINDKGDVLGRHDGLAFYTIGQRISIEVKKSNNKPFFVVDKNTKKNQLIVGNKNHFLLLKKEAVVRDINWISRQEPIFPLKCKVRLRHRQPLQSCYLEAQSNQRVVVKFSSPQRAVTPGQFAVFYLKSVCLGGGVIE